VSDLWNSDFDDEADDWLPLDFLDDDTSDDDIDQLHDIQRMVGQPIANIIDTFDHVARTGRAGEVRGVRFGSGSEALLWLFRRGIFLYSTLVKFPDGTWGVAIGNSPNVAPSGGDDNDADIPF
jgi:hypothetical protein